MLACDSGALKPVVSRKTMLLHHGKHHQAYVDKLDKVLGDQPALPVMEFQALLASLAAVSEPVRAAVRNNSCHLSHTMFWQAKHPGGTAMPTALGSRVEQDFGFVDSMKVSFVDAWVRQFGFS